MANNYYTFTPPFVPGTKVRSGQVNTQYQSIETAFDNLPTNTTALTVNTATFGVASQGAGLHQYDVVMPTTRTANNNGDEVVFQSSHDNVSATSPVVNIDTIGDVPVVLADGSAAPADLFTLGRFYELRYDAANTSFIVMSETDTFTSATAASAAAAAASAAAALVSEGNASTSETNAATSSNTAQEWAANPIDDDISTNPGEFSALHHSAGAKEWSQRAEDDAVPVNFGGDALSTFSAFHWAQKAASASSGTPTGTGVVDPNTSAPYDYDAELPFFNSLLATTAVVGWDGASIFKIRNLARTANTQLVSTNSAGVENTAIEYDSVTGVKLSHIAEEVARTRTAATGGLEVNNTLTGAGFERVITEGDLATISVDTLTGTGVIAPTTNAPHDYDALHTYQNANLDATFTSGWDGASTFENKNLARGGETTFAITTETAGTEIDALRIAPLGTGFSQVTANRSIVIDNASTLIDGGYDNAIQIGTSNQNIAMSTTAIQARFSLAATSLNVNPGGGGVFLGRPNFTRLAVNNNSTIQLLTTGGKSFTVTNGTGPDFQFNGTGFNSPSTGGTQNVNLVLRNQNGSGGSASEIGFNNSTTLKIANLVNGGEIQMYAEANSGGEAQLFRLGRNVADTDVAAAATQRIRLTATQDASLTSTNHAFQIGPDASVNIAMDSNKIMARNNGAVGDLFLNQDGGAVSVGGQTINDQYKVRNVTTTRAVVAIFNDPLLGGFDVVAGATYVIDGELILVASAAGTLMRVGLGSSSTFLTASISLGPPNATSGNSTNSVAIVGTGKGIDLPSSTALGSYSLGGRITMVGSGTVSLAWAALTTGTLDIRAGSWMSLRRIS